MKRLLISVIGLYFLTTQSMAVYYWFQDAKSHDFKPGHAFMTSILVGEGKGLVWPYFVFFHKQSERDIFKQTIETYFKGYGYISKATHLTGNSRKILEQEFSLISKGKALLSTCDFNLLNEIYPDWGNMVKDVYIPSIDLMIQGFQKRDLDNLSNMQKAVNQMETFHSWLDQNWNGLATALEKHGFKLIKKSEQKQNANMHDPEAANARSV